MAKLPDALDLLTVTVQAAQHRMPLYGVVGRSPQGEVRTRYFCHWHLNDEYSPYEKDLDVIPLLTGEANPLGWDRIAYVSHVPVHHCAKCKHVKVRHYNYDDRAVDAEWRSKKPHHR